MLIDPRLVKNRHSKNVNNNVCDSLSTKVIHFDISVQFKVRLDEVYKFCHVLHRLDHTTGCNVYIVPQTIDTLTLITV